MGGPEMMMVGVAILMLFGAKKVPELMKGLGQGIKEFKKASREIQDDIQQAMEDEPAPPPRKPAGGSSQHWTDKTVTKSDSDKE